MEERKTLFDYLGQIFMIFGITVMVLNVFCLLFGESARELSTLFSLGNNGLSVATMVQFLLVSAIIVALRFLFFTDVIIKNMPVVGRTIGMVIIVLIIMSMCISLFGWFPVDMWQPWVMFFLCFSISFIISIVVTGMKERAENKKMEEALKRIKQEEK